MPTISISLYRTDVIDGIVQEDSTLLTLDLDDTGHDGVIDRTEWEAYVASLAESTVTAQTPPALFHSTPHAATSGTLYSPQGHVSGDNVNDLLRSLQSGRVAPSITGLNICFLAGTMIATPAGEVAVETLRAGDRVLTRDHGAQPLVWTAATRITRDHLDLAPNTRPIRIAAGALGNDLPRRKVEVSPQHRVMIAAADGNEYLISARHLMMAGTAGVSLRPLTDEFLLVHIACADHEVLLAEGAPMESFFTGRMAVRALPLAQRIGLIASFPAIGSGENPMTPARPFINHRDYARMMATLA